MEDRMTHDKLLTKMAMELPEWPDTRDEVSKANDIIGPNNWMVMDNALVEYVASHAGIPGFFVERSEWLDERERLINKPSWDDAPDDCDWLAQDSDGEWVWHPTRPKINMTGDLGPEWFGSRLSYKYNHAADGVIPAGHNWRTTLEARPQEQSVESRLHDDARAWGTLAEPKTAFDILLAAARKRNEAREALEKAEGEFQTALEAANAALGDGFEIRERIAEVS